jgi:hypothetical protein
MSYATGRRFELLLSEIGQIAGGSLPSPEAFSDAYIEMTPVIRKELADKGFHFKVPDIGYLRDLASGRACMDTLIRAVLPDKGYVISDGQQGYGWITHMGVDSSLLSGSGYIMEAYRDEADRILEA